MRKVAPATDYPALYQNGYMDKSRPWKDYYEAILDLHPDSVYDYGCGNGSFIAQLVKDSPLTHACGWDPYHSQIGDIDYQLTYEMVTCFDVLEHMLCEEQVDQALATLKRHCEPCGVIVLAIANMPDIHKINGEEVDLHTFCRDKDWWHVKLSDAYPEAHIEPAPLRYPERFWFFIYT